LKRFVILVCTLVSACAAAQDRPSSSSSAGPPANWERPVPTPSSVQKTPATPPEAQALVDRVGNTGFIDVRGDSFNALTSKQKQLAYWLYQASVAIDPIFYDQLSAYGLRQKRLLEEIIAHRQGIEDTDALMNYAKLFWANRGNHNEVTSQKFLPEFTASDLELFALVALHNHAFSAPVYGLPALTTEAAVKKELQELGRAFFDPNFEPMITAKSPQGGKDIVQASSNTYYQGVTAAEADAFYKSSSPTLHPLTSRLVKRNGKIEELVYRAGTPDGRVAPGLYATYLKKANEYLARAQKFADAQQAKVIGDLIRFYQTGDFADWLKFGEDWVQNDEEVDFANGFIEVYRDARGAKGSSQSFVSVTDRPVTELLIKLAANAEYFEQKAPWADQYKKTNIKPPVVKAVETLIETGDFSVTTVGDNLPNENQIHEKFGTKNFLFTSSSRALQSAAGYCPLEEFAAGPEEIERGKKYGEQASMLMTAMHEVIGHGSGKLSTRVAPTGAERYLKEYFSTLEEGRADLMALWNAWDPKLQELGLIKGDQQEIAKMMYDNAVRAPLVQLRSIPRGDTVEEDHQRDRQLIVRYIQDKVPGSIEQFDRDGKTYIRVADYQKMRQGVGMLLAELMRIKAEGDYNAIKALVDKYAVHFDPAVRDQIVTRYKKLNLPSYWAGAYSKLTRWQAHHSSAAAITISYPRNVVQQFLDYGAMYDSNLTASTSQSGDKARSDQHRLPATQQK
jgi:dipeptidyl-peptidase-3